MAKLTMQQLDQLERELEELKTMYEKYFIGIDRIEPADRRKTVKRKIALAAESPVVNTAVRFRAQQLKARLVTYENYWNRILKQIEDGTYHRHKFRVRMMEEQQTGGGTSGHVDLGGGGKKPGYDDVIDQYRDVQQAVGAKPVDRKKMAGLLKKQEDQLKNKFKAKRVEFRVEVVDGKPKLKAKPIK